MFVIITYDVNEKRVGKVCKKLREHLTWTQNSVFEGEITKGQFLKCRQQVEKIINPEEDSIYYYIVENPKNIKKEFKGTEKGDFDIFF
ncbi:CRISPR-associated protein Cas2 [Ureibacillus massiliensis 4400831 = CIP 108448 = CCUG 49529]|uniref:CRISPR-associated endoribonuclease Cas2 n=1 Tax=Ureibacillus massiliensis 4400831 = CIP 108448 = CCUG 49529 TaxID=1211035 RepID=A0A0A3J5U6_9BACL|nr:CRISPR-associated endonuclease Cas2 [Ureibacillus massiliensis]KGR92399.1 CRISPR-associated protein Cas2 [Ureibacillus massiliensis 4400831 = CIP 108448 = CCUG 49529]